MPFVYIIKSGLYYKIGVANNVENRIAQLSTGNPFELELVSCFEFDNAIAIETSLHQKFSKSRERGEWFKLNKRDISEFGKICSLLGGKSIPNNVPPTEDEIAVAEQVAEITEDTKWDFRAMFAEGWRMEVGGDGTGKYNYWCWRKRTKDINGYLYGGRLKDLPYPIEQMRKIFGGS